MTKASDNAFPSILITEGTEPSAPAAGKQRLYIDSTTHKLKRTDSSGTDVTVEGGLADQGVVTYLDFTTAAAPSSPAAGKIRVYSKTGDTLAQKTSGGTETVFGAGGGGVGWNQDINEDGSSFANFTAASGTWGTSAGKITQTDTAGSWRRTKYNTLIPLGFPLIMEAEMAVLTASGRAAIGISDGTNGNGLTVQLQQGTGILVDLDAAANIRTITATINTSTTYKLRVVMGNGWISIYLDGTLVANVPVIRNAGWDDNAEFFGLFSYGASVTFDNIKVWTLSTGAPA